MGQTAIYWGTRKNTEKQMFPFAGQIPHSCGPPCPQSLTQTSSQANGEEFRRKELDAKAKENAIWHATKICLCESYFFIALKHFIIKSNIHNPVCHDCLSKCSLLYQSIFITLQDIQNYPAVDTTGYSNPQLLNVKGVICMHMHKHTKSSK